MTARSSSLAVLARRGSGEHAIAPARCYCRESRHHRARARSILCTRHTRLRRGVVGEDVDRSSIGYRGLSFLWLYYLQGLLYLGRNLAGERREKGRGAEAAGLWHTIPSPLLHPPSPLQLHQSAQQQATSSVTAVWPRAPVCWTRGRGSSRGAARTGDVGARLAIVVLVARIVGGCRGAGGGFGRRSGSNIAHLEAALPLLLLPFTRGSPATVEPIARNEDGNRLALRARCTE